MQSEEEIALEKGYDLKLVCYSECSESDWYGEYTYYHNPLTRFAECTKHCIYTPKWATGRGSGIKSVTVYTSREFLDYMGWGDLEGYIIKRKDA